MISDFCIKPNDMKERESGNFGIRKHLLEYDSVMIKQRVAVYTKRHHALMGKRISMDIVNDLGIVAYML